MENNDGLVQVPDEHSLKGRTGSVHLRYAWERLSVNSDMALAFLNDIKMKNQNLSFFQTPLFLRVSPSFSGLILNETQEDKCFHKVSINIQRDRTLAFYPVVIAPLSSQEMNNELKLVCFYVLREGSEIESHSKETLSQKMRRIKMNSFGLL